jgi:tRNA (guanosine-2'-O-)-methyltransferase
MLTADGSTRGYFGIGIYRCIKSVNVGTLWRSAFAMNASFIFTIENPYVWQASDTVKASRHIPLFHFGTFERFLEHRPDQCVLVAVEIHAEAKLLPDFIHPERAVYLLGSEAAGLPETIIRRCPHRVRIPSDQCLNVSTAGSIIMYDRMVKAA